MLYGGETRATKERGKKRLDMIEMKCLGSRFGVTRMDRIRNEEMSGGAK